LITVDGVPDHKVPDVAKVRDNVTVVQYLLPLVLSDGQGKEMGRKGAHLPLSGLILLQPLLVPGSVVSREVLLLHGRPVATHCMSVVREVEDEVCRCRTPERTLRLLVHSLGELHIGSCQGTSSTEGVEPNASFFAWKLHLEERSSRQFPLLVGAALEGKSLLVAPPEVLDEEADGTALRDRDRRDLAREPEGETCRKQ
jgi:hypothetical protein